MYVKIPAILIALTFHELSHGITAKFLGDDTAEKNGRLTLNPLSHIDVIGALMLFFGPFGWAKPVPVNPMNFKNPKKDMAIVAVAGPLANILIAALTGFIIKTDISGWLWNFAIYFFYINIGLAVFNLLPIYPLDGSRILVAFLNRRQVSIYLKSMRVVPLIFIIMMSVEWLLKFPILSYILNPIFSPAYKMAIKLFIGS